MINRFKQLGKDSFVYGIGGILAKVMGIFLMPVYTRIFTPADYGIITMLGVITSFLRTVLVMGMDSAQSFYFFEQKTSGKTVQARVVTAIFQWRLSWGTVILGVALLISPFLNTAFFNGQLTWHYFVLAFIGCLFSSLAKQSVELFRLLYRPWGFISINLGIAIISAGVALLLIVGFKWGILGFFVGSAIGSLSMAIIGWWANRTFLDWSLWHRDWWPRLLRFGAPLVPAGLAMYVLNTSDRWFISHYCDQDALGLYAVGAKFALLIALAVTTFRQAWWPIAMNAMHSPDGPELFRIIARLYLGLGSAGIVLLTAFSPLLVSWLTGPAFHSAYPIVGILAWHSMFYGFYLIGAAGIWKMEKTAWAPLLMGSAALLNIGLDAWLVPQYGGMGAAVGTSLSFLIWNIMTLIVSERLWPVGYTFRIFALQISIGAVSCFVILQIHEKGQSLWGIASVTLVAIFVLGALSVTRKHFVTMMKLIYKKAGKQQ